MSSSLRCLRACAQRATAAAQQRSTAVAHIQPGTVRLKSFHELTRLLDIRVPRAVACVLTSVAAQQLVHVCLGTPAIHTLMASKLRGCSLNMNAREIAVHLMFSSAQASSQALQTPRQAGHVEVSLHDTSTPLCSSIAVIASIFHYHRSVREVAGAYVLDLHVTSCSLACLT